VLSLVAEPKQMMSAESANTWTTGIDANSRIYVD